MKGLIVGFVVLLLANVIAADDCFNSTEKEVDAREAYCYYYASPSLSFDYTTVFINATSNNVFAHATVWVNSELEVGGQKLADCEPMEADGNTCNTADSQYSYDNTDGNTMYVLVCLECHYWVDDCDFDGYNGCLNGEAKEGVVSCPECK